MIPGFAVLYPGYGRYVLMRRRQPMSSPSRRARDERIELAREAIRDAVRAQRLRFDE